VIDESSINNTNKYTAFLDINFCFDNEGQLQTDLFTKETDARSYLYFGSSHPNHVYSGVIYSQCTRLRRIINDHTRLIGQLETLKECFKQCNYPPKMVTNIVEKVKTLPRLLKRKGSAETSPLKPSPLKLRVISTFEADEPLVNTTEQYAPSLQSTKSFSASSSLASSRSEVDPNQPGPSNRKLFQYVKKTGTNLRSKLVRAKSLAMGGKGKTSPCNKPRCKCCEMICDQEELKVNNTKVMASKGSCTSYNIIYLFMCTLCNKPYVGRTVSPLATRTSQHRAAFYKLVSHSHKSTNFDQFCENDDDTYSLGLHLIKDHQKSSKENFNEFYRVLILQSCSPSTLDVKEHKWIHKLNSLKPLGINSSNPFSIPILIFENHSAIT